MGRVSGFIRLSRRAKLLFAEAFLLHLWTGLLLKVVPFRRIPEMFRGREPEAAAEDALPGMLSEKQSEAVADDVLPGMLRENQSEAIAEGELPSIYLKTVEEIKTAVARASAVSPWRNKCLVSSLAARRMLNRRKIASRVSLGVAKNAVGKTVAHAWITAGEVEMVEKAGDFTELYNF